MKSEVNKNIKTAIGIMFNILGAILVFDCRVYPYDAFVKMTGILGLIFSYYIFHADYVE